MSQYQPPQGTPGPYGGQPQFGQGSAPQQPYGQQQGGYGASSAPVPGQQAPGQQPGPYGQQQAGGPYAGSTYPTATAGPGLFDTTFATPSTPATAKIAYVAIIVLAGVLALGGVVGAISSFSYAVEYGEATNFLSGVVALLKGFALGFVVLTVGRLFVDHFVQQHRALESAKD